MRLPFKDLMIIIQTAMELIQGEEDQESSDPYYDLIDDFDLIVSSFQSQYGLRLSKEIPAGMPWDEFSDLLSGIGPDTALGRIVAIRAEEDEEILKHFTRNSAGSAANGEINRL